MSKSLCQYFLIFSLFLAGAWERQGWAGCPPGKIAVKKAGRNASGCINPDNYGGSGRRDWKGFSDSKKKSWCLEYYGGYIAGAKGGVASCTDKRKLRKKLPPEASRKPVKAQNLDSAQTGISLKKPKTDLDTTGIALKKYPNPPPPPPKKESFMERFGRKMYTPLGRLITSGVMGGLALTVHLVTKKEEERIENRIKTLENMRDTILKSRGYGLNRCSKNDFENPQKPYCYCYHPKGGVNHDRDPKVCSSVFSYQEASFVAGGGAAPKLRGCVTMNGDFDKNCQCRKRKGRDACVKIRGVQIPGLKGGALNDYQEAIRAANNMIGGNQAAAATYSSQGGQRLANLGKKQASKILKTSPARIDGEIKKATRELLSSPYVRSLSMGRSGSPLSQIRSDGIAKMTASLPQKTKDELDKQIGSLIKEDSSYSKGSGRRGSRSSKRDQRFLGQGMDYNLDYKGDDEKHQKIMAKKFNYGNSDVFQNSSASLFQVLSVRYQRSAYRRLFESEDIIKADKPNRTDIRR